MWWRCSPIVVEALTPFVVEVLTPFVVEVLTICSGGAHTICSGGAHTICSGGAHHTVCPNGPSCLIILAMFPACVILLFQSKLLINTRCLVWPCLVVGCVCWMSFTLPSYHALSLKLSLSTLSVIVCLSCTVRLMRTVAYFVAICSATHFVKSPSGSIMHTKHHTFLVPESPFLLKLQL